MPDYIQFICPLFTDADANFQRIPTVDTSEYAVNIIPLIEKQFRQVGAVLSGYPRY